jgi:hypothetical protein
LKFSLSNPVGRGSNDQWETFYSFRNEPGSKMTTKQAVLDFEFVGRRFESYRACHSPLARSRKPQILGLTSYSLCVSISSELDGLYLLIDSNQIVAGIVQVGSAHPEPSGYLIIRVILLINQPGCRLSPWADSWDN